MSALDGGLPIVRGLVDSGGRLIEADPRLADLNAHAGGAIGAPIAVPQLATLARLARRLDTLISRGVLAADGEHDIDLWVRAEPTTDGVRLALTGWRPRPIWTPPAGEATRDVDFVRNDADWLWETDAALRLTYVSVTAAAHEGADLETLLGQPLTRLFMLDDDDAGGAPMLGALALRQRFDAQPAVLRASGRAVELAAAPRLDPRGGFTGFVGAARLVREPVAPKPAEPQDAFSTRLDRALRAPLGRIIANADSMHQQGDGPLGDNYASYAADIATAGRHLLGLVDDLVDLQAIERPDFKVAREAIDLADLARRAAGLLAVRAGDAGVTIDRPAIGEALPATGEFRRALQILVNLIGNAVRYSPKGSTVWVRAEREGSIAAVIVADQGKGIALDDQARIFEKFARVDPSEPGGSGLGLYIARRLARAMGGDITVDSAPGQGARFLFTLPAGEG
ncbi:sensor histidine kinase [Sphingomonas koreensis]|nr:sensor histidine kinase [Sphingomonas koreensis]